MKILGFYYHRMKQESAERGLVLRQNKQVFFCVEFKLEAWALVLLFYNGQQLEFLTLQV